MKPFSPAGRGVLKRKTMKPRRAWAVLTVRGRIPLRKPGEPILCVGNRHLGDFVMSPNERVVYVEIREVTK